MTYFIFYVFLLTFFIPLVHNLVLLIGVSGKIKIREGFLFTGEIIDIDYNIENKAIFPIPYIEVRSNIFKSLTGEASDKKVFSLEKKKSLNYKEEVILKRRGFYDLGDIQITIRDVFGFYSLRKTISSNILLLIYPEPISLSTFQVVASQKPGPLSVQNSVFKDKNRVTSLRDYREGDSIKSVHWKLSAKKDNIIIKEYDNPGDNNVIIFIDNYIDNFKNDVNRRLEDKIADTGLSIVNYCLKENIKVSLETQIGKKPIYLQGESDHDLKAFLDLLARFKGDGFLSFESLIRSKLDFLPQASTIIIITPNLDKEMGAMGIHLRSKNFNPIFIAIGDRLNKTGYMDQEVKNLFNLESIPLYFIDYTGSIKEVLEAHYG